METKLPVEIIEVIMCCENVSISDVVNFSQTNNYYYNAIRNGNTMWKKKYFQTWPQFSKLFEINDPNFCWYEEIRYIFDLKRKTREILAAMSSRFYKCYQLLGSDFIELIELYKDEQRAYYYLMDDLSSIISNQIGINSMEVVPITTAGNKTLQYYASKAFKFLLHFHLIEEWLTYVRLPVRLQTFEKGAVVLSQWLRKNIDVSCKNAIPIKFDELAEKVKEHLKMVDPNHPLFTVPKEELKRWREENIEGNKYDAENCEKVVQALEKILGKLDEINYGFDIELLNDHTFFKEILAAGLLETCRTRNALLLMYESVARRLGLKYEILFALHAAKRFALRFSNGFGSAEETLTESVFSVASAKEFLDSLALDHTEMVTGDDNLYKIFEDSTRVRPDLLLLKLFQYLDPLTITSADTFMEKCYVDKTDQSSSFLLSVMQQRVRNLQLVQCTIKIQLEKFARENRSKSFQKTARALLRPTKLKYAVGMVMKSHGGTCIICDWKMVFSDLREQPVYKVLQRSGLYEAVLQDELKPCASKDFRFPTEIGMHFSHVFATYFVPNAEKEREYPADTAVRRRYHKILMVRNKRKQ